MLSNIRQSSCYHTLLSYSELLIYSVKNQLMLKLFGSDTSGTNISFYWRIKYYSFIQWNCNAFDFIALERVSENISKISSILL